ncbi:HAMP domain-containing protein [Dactylosporangium siamense]|uniref:histidine kinase n=1 Tax=Dactylosporangium siamense TaxID=685454 RepID=A0A919PSQ9_9ACTN|nr:HAMP domain-containing protein [Dactylosporangium siamense]GIG49037.1 hypothetical protein Dsi01nite_070780 [Dactylosporangium siamense]
MRGVEGGLTRRMVLATCVLLLFVGGAFGTLLISIGEDRETTRLSRRSHQLFTAADQVHRKTVDLQAAQQAYTISGDGVFLGRWQAAQTGVYQANATLEGLASTDSQRRQTQQITRTSASYVQDYSIPALNAARRGDPAARSASSLLEGERRIEQLRTDLGVLRVSEGEFLAARDARAEAMARREMFAVVAGLAGSAIVIALVGGYQTRLLVQPIRRAATMADRLAGGQLGTRMPETGKAEIGQLERSFNVMGDSLQGAHDDLVASRARVVLATDQARRRIERDLHDGVQQRLLSLGLDIRRIELSVPAELPELRAELAEVVAGINGTVDDVREISRGVHPAILTEGGLRPAVKALARRSAVPVELDLRLEDRLPEPLEVAAYYVVAEALANAAKHSGASAIRVGASVRDGQLEVSVRDNGAGGAAPGRGSGLVGLADRIEALGGTFDLDSPPGHGTHLEVRLPLT